MVPIWQFIFSVQHGFMTFPRGHGGRRSTGRRRSASAGQPERPGRRRPQAGRAARPRRLTGTGNHHDVWHHDDSRPGPGPAGTTRMTGPRRAGGHVTVTARSDTGRPGPGHRPPGRRGRDRGVTRGPARLAAASESPGRRSHGILLRASVTSLSLTVTVTVRTVVNHGLTAALLAGPGRPGSTRTQARRAESDSVGPMICNGPCRTPRPGPEGHWPRDRD